MSALSKIGCVGISNYFRGTKLMDSYRYRAFKVVAVLVVLAIVGVSIAACQTSEPDSSVTSAVNQANQAAQEAAAAAQAAADAAQQASMAAQDNTAITVAEEAKLVANDASTAALVAASAAQDASSAAKLAAEAAMAVPATSMEDPGSLVIYSGRSESLVAPIIEQFAEVTGVDVKVKYGSTFALAATLLEEGSNSPADVFFAQDPGGLGAVSSMLSALPADVVLKVPAWARASDGSWVGISGRARVLVYSTELVSEDELPTSVNGTDRPQVEGQAGMASRQRLVPHDGNGHATDVGRGGDPPVAARHAGQRAGRVPEEHSHRGGRGRG